MACLMKESAVATKCCLFFTPIVNKLFWTFGSPGDIFLILVPIVTNAEQSLLSTRLTMGGLVCVRTIFIYNQDDGNKMVHIKYRLLRMNNMQ